MTQVASLKQPVEVSQAKSIPLTRIASIDIVRALTMVLMIFVNDLGIIKRHSRLAGACKTRGRWYRPCRCRVSCISFYCRTIAAFCNGKQEKKRRF